jgi:hypothetical protein
MTKATPSKLRDGSWGARVQGSVQQGAIIEINTKAGKTWTATVQRVLWTDGKVTLVQTESSKGTSSPRPRRSSNGECQCGACDDLLSFGYRPGQRIRCPKCGGWAEAY